MEHQGLVFGDQPFEVRFVGEQPVLKGAPLSGVGDDGGDAPQRVIQLALGRARDFHAVNLHVGRLVETYSREITNVYRVLVFPKFLRIDLRVIPALVAHGDVVERVSGLEQAASIQLGNADFGSVLADLATIVARCSYY